MLGTADITYGQFAGTCRAPSPLAVQGGELAAGGQTFQLVPSICVSERYDSNVFYRPVTKGLERHDYVTTVNPTLRGNHRGDYASGFWEAGGFYETYVNNSGLNFFGSNGILSLDLDNTVKRLLPNAGLRIADSVSYIPTPPGFSNPVAGTNPGSPVNFQDAFAQGVLFTRTN